MTPVSEPQPQPFYKSPAMAWAIAWVAVSASSFAVGWFSFSKVEEAIPLTGTLEQKATFKSVLAPAGTVIKQVYVQPGQRVATGDLLISFDQSVSRAKFDELQQRRQKLAQENRFYQAVLQQKPSPDDLDQLSKEIQVPSDVIALSRERLTLLEEIQAARSLLQARSTSRQSATPTPATSSQAEIEGWQAQLQQAQILLDDAQLALTTSQNMLTDLEGAASGNANSTTVTGEPAPQVTEADLARQREVVRSKQAEVNRLQEQVRQLEQVLDIARQQANTTGKAQPSQPTDDPVAAQRQRLAEIEQQFQNALTVNTKQLEQLDQDLAKNQRTLKDELLNAPIAGIVTDLQATFPGFVTNGIEPLLKIVPDGAMVAKVYIAQRDLPFVEAGEVVDLRLDNTRDLPLLKGRIVRIDTKASATTQAKLGIPAEVHLLQLPAGSQTLPLRSGMAVTATIRIQDRLLIQVIGNWFAKWSDRLRGF